MSKTYVELIVAELKGQLVEVFTGTYAKNRHYSDFDHQQKDVIRGTIVNGESDMLVMEVSGITGKNKIYINGWSITAVVKPQHGMSMIDMFLDEHEKQVK